MNVFEITEVAPVVVDDKLQAISFALTGVDGDVTERTIYSTPATMPERDEPYVFADYRALCANIATQQGLYDAMAVKMEARKVPAAAPTTPVPVVMTEAQKRATWVSQIDATVAQVYSQYTRFQLEYEMREAAAQAFKDAGYTGEPTVWIKSFADNTGITYQACADLILSQAVKLRGAMTLLGSLRMDKYKILTAGTLEEASAAFDAIIAQVGAIAGSL